MKIELYSCNLELTSHPTLMMVINNAAPGNNLSLLDCDCVERVKLYDDCCIQLKFGKAQKHVCSNFV